MNGMCASVFEYWGEAIRPRSRLSKIIVPLLIIKAIAILLIWVTFFGPSTKHDPGSSEIDAHVFLLPAEQHQDNIQ